MNQSELYKQIIEGEISQEESERIARRKKIIFPDRNVLPEGVQIIAGDFRQVELPQVDCIITELHPKKVALCGDLAKMAAEKVKPGGLIAVLCSQVNLPEVISQMSGHLQWHWLVEYNSPRGLSIRDSERRVRSFHKPVAVFSVGKYAGPEMVDLCKGEKLFSDYGQTVASMLEIVKLIAQPGQTILDPMAGEGTIGVAAVRMACNFIGVTGKFEADDAKRRLCLL